MLKKLPSIDGNLCLGASNMFYLILIDCLKALISSIADEDTLGTEISILVKLLLRSPLVISFFSFIEVAIHTC